MLQAFLCVFAVKQLNNNIVYNKNGSYKVKCWQLTEVELHLYIRGAMYVCLAGSVAVRVCH